MKVFILLMDRRSVLVTTFSLPCYKVSLGSRNKAEVVRASRGWWRESTNLSREYKAREIIIDVHCFLSPLAEDEK